MAPEERYRMFDKALARHLRSAAPAGEAAGIPVVSPSQSGACPDPETLAAYHERSLLPEQLNFLKEHVVGCANCQNVLAHLEITDDIPLPEGGREQVLNQTAAAPAAVSSQAPARSPEARTRRSRRVLLLKGARWQWLAPAGAIAAGLLVWIALHENRPLPLPALNANESKMAKNQVPPAPLPSGSLSVPQSSIHAEPPAALTRQPSSVGEYAVSNGRVASDAAKQSAALGGAAGARPANALGDREFRARKDDARDESVDQLTAANRADLDTKNLPESLQKKKETQVARVQAEIVQSPDSQNQNQINNYVPQKVAGPGPLNQADSSRKAKSTAVAAPAAPAPQPGEAGGAVTGYANSPEMEVASAISNPRLISSPGSNATTWLAGRQGLIEFSKDGGSSWSRQTSGVLVDLLTGSAPSPQVCWIVGRVGAVLLTIDGGAHWKVTSSPLTEDLGGVRATDALHAIIWNARSTKSFETSDGGLTWTAIPHP